MTEPDHVLKIISLDKTSIHLEAPIVRLIGKGEKKTEMKYWKEMS